LVRRRGCLLEEHERAKVDRPGAEDAAVGLQLEVDIAGPEANEVRPRGNGRPSFEVMGFGYTHRLVQPSRLLPPGRKWPFGGTFADHPAVGPPWAQGGSSEF